MVVVYRYICFIVIEERLVYIDGAAICNFFFFSIHNVCRKLTNVSNIWYIWYYNLENRERFSEVYLKFVSIVYFR